MFLQNHLIYFIRFPIHSNSLWNKRQSLKEQIAGNSLSVEYWRWPPPPEIERCLMAVWTLCDLRISWCMRQRRLMWPPQIAVVLISLTARWITDTGRLQAPVWHRLTSFEGKRGGTNTSLEVKDLRDPRSQREREKRVGELLRRGMEGMNMKDNTGNIKRGRETEKVQCRQQNGIWQERAWHPLIKLWWFFSARSTWEVNQGVSFNT